MAKACFSYSAAWYIKWHYCRQKVSHDLANELRRITGLYGFPHGPRQRGQPKTLILYRHFLKNLVLVAVIHLKSNHVPFPFTCLRQDARLFYGNYTARVLQGFLVSLLF